MLHRTIGAKHVLFTDNMVLICREGNPLLSLEDDRETIDNAAHVLLLPEEQNFSGLRQRVQEMFPDRQINFTSYNILIIAALVANSDMLAIIPSRFYNLFSRCWPLEKPPFPSLNEEQIDFSIHYNKFSLRDPILHGVIDVIRNAFWKSIVTARSQRRTIKWHNPTTILHFRDRFGCFQVRFNDILPVVNSKIVDNYNNLLNWNAFLRNSQLEHARYE